MAAATLYKLFKIYKTIHAEEIGVLVLGSAVAFVVAMIAIKFFIGVVSRFGFKGFGYYRVAVGVLILFLN